MNKQNTFFVSASLALSLVACGDPDKYPQKLEEARVVGVQISGEGDRALLAPGTQAEVSILLSGPRGPVETKVAFSLCPALDVARGVPTCAEESYFDVSLEASNRPRATLELSSEAADGEHLALVGVACESGEPQLALDPLEWSCDGSDSEPLRFSFDTWVVGEGIDDNQNPDLGGARLSLGDEDLALEGWGREASCGDAVSVALGATVKIGFQLPESVREEFEIQTGERAGELTTEALQISHFATRGLLERQYTIVDPDESLDFELEFEAPDLAGPVKSYFVVRDGRAGVGFGSFSLCIE